MVTVWVVTIRVVEKSSATDAARKGEVERATKQGEGEATRGGEEREGGNERRGGRQVTRAGEEWKQVFAEAVATGEM